MPNIFGRRSIFIFDRTTNSFIGRLTREDLALLVDGGRFGAWDHIWVPYLVNANRITVQMNLDLGMAITPHPKDRYWRNMSSNERINNLHRQRRTRYLDEVLEGADANNAIRMMRFQYPMNMFCYSAKL